MFGVLDPELVDRFDWCGFNFHPGWPQLSEAEERRLWPACRRAVWLRTSRSLTPIASRELDGVEVPALADLQNNIGLLFTIENVERFRRWVRAVRRRDLRRIALFEESRAGHQLVDVLAILRGDLEELAEAALAAVECRKENPHAPIHVWRDRSKYTYGQTLDRGVDG